MQPVEILQSSLVERLVCSRGLPSEINSVVSVAHLMENSRLYQFLVFKILENRKLWRKPICLLFLENSFRKFEGTGDGFLRTTRSCFRNSLETPEIKLSKDAIYKKRRRANWTCKFAMAWLEARPQDRELNQKIENSIGRLKMSRPSSMEENDQLLYHGCRSWKTKYRETAVEDKEA